MNKKRNDDEASAERSPRKRPKDDFRPQPAEPDPRAVDPRRRTRRASRAARAERG
jgi:hypothetical protein